MLIKTYLSNELIPGFWYNNKNNRVYKPTSNRSQSEMLESSSNMTLSILNITLMAILGGNCERV